MKKWLKRTLVLLCTVMLIACAGVALTGCGKTKKGHTHEWDSGTIVTAATCTTDGEMLFKCTGCDETKTETIKAGHTWKDTVTAPTCTEDGYTTHTCEKCGTTRKDTIVDAKHNYVKTSHKATCESDGYDEYVCSACGDEYQEITAKATGHNTLSATWEVDESKDKKISGCTYERTEVATCATCGESVEKTYEIHKHEYSVSVTTEATCSAKGEKTYQCKHCDDSYAEDYKIVDTAHAWVEGTTENGVTTYVCSHNSAHTKTEIDLTGRSEPTVEVSQKAIASGAELKMDNATMKLDDTLKGKLTGDVELTAGKYDQDDETVSEAIDKLSASDKERLGDAPIFNFGLQSGGQDVDFGGGKITVSVPYELQDGEDPDCIAIAYIKDDGTIVIIEAKYANGFATFEAEHFSLYTVVRMTAAERCEKYGHGWVTTTAKATCTEDGYTLKRCKYCHKTEREDFVKATGHDYATSVVAPTCTSSGYTSYTCKNEGCGDSYTSNRTEATSHSYKETVVKPTCTADGYTVYLCDKCQKSYVDDYTDKLGHDYKDGACSVCGAKDPAAVEADKINFYLNMIQSVMNADMSLYMESKDLNVKITVPDVLLGSSTGRYLTSMDYDVVVNSLKMYYSLDENGNIFAKGEMSMTAKMKGNLADGVTSEDYNFDSDGTNVAKFVIKDNVLYAYSETTEVYDGETDKYTAYVSQPLFDSEDETFSAMSEILEAVAEKAQTIIDKVYALENNPLDDLVAKIVEYVFEKKATDDGYTFQLNYARFTEVYDAVMTKSIAEFYDAVFGTNAFVKTTTYLKESVDKTVNTIVGELWAQASKAGISAVDVYAMANAALALIPTENGEPMTVQQFLEAYGSMTIKSILDGVIPSEEPIDYAEMIDTFSAYLKEMTIMDAVEAISGMIGGGSSNGEIVDGPNYMSDTTTEATADPIRSLLEEVAKMLKTTTIGFKTDKLGNVLSFNLDLDIKDYALDLANLLGVDASRLTWVDSTTLKITAKGSWTTTIGGTMATEYNDLVAKLDAARKNLILADGASIEGGDGYSGYTVKLVDGETWIVPVFNERWLSKEEKIGEDEFGEKYLAGSYQTTYRFSSENLAFQYSTVCRGWEEYSITAIGRSSTYFYVWYNDDGEIVKHEFATEQMEEGYWEDWSFYFYYNTTTKKMQRSEPHNWQQIEYKKPTCAEDGYTKYRCSLCGETRTVYHSVSHEIRTTYELKEGSNSCEDGVLCIRTCLNCGKEIHRSEVNTHEMNNCQELVATTACGDLYLVYRQCACGEKFYLHGAYVEKTKVNGYGDTIKYLDYHYGEIYGACEGTFNDDYHYVGTSEGKTNYSYTVYTCYVTNCKFSYMYESYLVPSETTCTATRVYKYTFGLDLDGKPTENSKTYEFKIVEDAHNWGECMSFTDDVKQVSGSEWYCTKCGKLLSKYGYGYDEQGREIRSYDFVSNDGYIYEYVEDGESMVCYKTYHMNADGTKGEYCATFDHDWDSYESDATCSQYGVQGKICRHCHAISSDDWGRPHGHDFKPDAESGKYKCTVCGTYSDSDENGKFYLEDMSELDSYQIGFYNAYASEYTFGFELYLYKESSDGETETKTVVLDVDYEIFYYIANDGTQSVLCGIIAIDMQSLFEAFTAWETENAALIEEGWEFGGFGVAFNYHVPETDTYIDEQYTLDPMVYFQWIYENGGYEDVQ